ncbi:MAG: bifunctional riboflavin kinase/FAD synthetase [bacterium]
MKIFWRIPAQFEYENVGLTIGVFDGVHLGHQKIITELINSCRKKGLTSLILTFEIHPRKILSATMPALLITLDQRLNIISQLGMDVCIITDFEQEIMNLEATEFIEKVLIDKLKMKQMWIGTNFLFGRGRKGDVQLLQELSAKKGFKLQVVEPVKFEDEIVSSTRIREYLKQGEVAKANLLLSRPYTIGAEVIHGTKRGRILGYPTANLKWDEEVLLPEKGVYAVRVKMDDERYEGVANLGYRPTFGEEKELYFEVHIFDFNQEIYFKELNVSFITRIRDEKPFKDQDSLIRQLNEDENKAKQILKASKW